MHGALFDITTGQNLEGIKLAAPKGIELPKEMMEMFARTMEIVSKVKIDPLTIYKVQVKNEKVRVALQ